MRLECEDSGGHFRPREIDPAGQKRIGGSIWQKNQTKGMIQT
jgi:hypothetical protein